MQSHLVDLVSALDLREKVSNPTKLKDVLGGLGRLSPKRSSSKVVLQAVSKPF